MEWYKDGMYPEWHISGEDFSPKELLHHFPFLILGRTHEKTDIGKLGPSKGKEYGYGSTVIVVDDSIIFKLDWLLDFILENGQKIRNLGVKEELLWLVWWGIQGNMELDKKLLTKIAKTELNMAMNYYYINGKWEFFNI
jgi:hypothetical protein